MSSVGSLERLKNSGPGLTQLSHVMTTPTQHRTDQQSKPKKFLALTFKLGAQSPFGQRGTSPDAPLGNQVSVRNPAIELRDRQAGRGWSRKASASWQRWLRTWLEIGSVTSLSLEQVPHRKSQQVNGVETLQTRNLVTVDEQIDLKLDRDAAGASFR